MSAHMPRKFYPLLVDILLPSHSSGPLEFCGALSTVVVGSVIDSKGRYGFKDLTPTSDRTIYNSGVPQPHDTRANRPTWIDLVSFRQWDPRFVNNAG